MDEFIGPDQRVYHIALKTERACFYCLYEQGYEQMPWRFLSEENLSQRIEDIKNCSLHKQLA